SQILKPEDFYKPAHRVVYQAILETYDAHEQADVLAVEERLSRQGLLEEVGGRPVLLEILGSVVSAAGINYHATLVRDKSVQRQLLEVCLDISRQAYENAAAPAALLEEAEERIFKIARMNVAQEVKGIDAVLQETFERIDFFRSRTGEPPGL